MSKIFIPLILLLLNFTVSTAQEWHTDIDEAKEIAISENKKIVLLFTGSDWCPPCKKLEKNILSTEVFKSYAKENFVLLKADFPKRKKNRLTKEQKEKNNKLAERYNKRKVFPVIMVLNEKGDVIGTTGYRKFSAERYVELLANIASF
ncbi:thioredoxin family protein [Aquimarina rhabdastrellae]